MSKVATTLGVLVLGSGVSLTGAYALGAFDPDYELPEKWDDSAGNKGFKQKGFDEGCVQSMFPGIENKSTDGIPSSTSDAVNTNYFGTDKTTKGCLVVNGDKETYDADKWQGTFRFLGVVKSEKHKGFVVFTSGSTSNTTGSDQKITWSGESYEIEWKDTDKKGSIKSKQPAGNNKTFINNSDDNKFPRKGNAITSEKLKDKQFWNFFESKEKVGNICQSSTNCTDKTKKKESSFRGYGIGEEKTGSSKKLSEGTQETDKWWKEIYDDANGKMNDAVKDKAGEGTEKVVYLNV